MANENVSNTEKYFKKPYILLNLLNQNKELSRDEIAEKMGISKQLVMNLINEFNRDEEAIKYKDGKYYTDKKKLQECKSYMKIINIIEAALACSKDFFTMNENDLATLFKVDRKIIQKVKTLIKSELPLTIIKE